jgi:broad specificity phosphatase PhoE
MFMRNLILYCLLLIYLVSCSSDCDEYPEILSEYLDDPYSARLADFSFAGYEYGVKQPQIFPDGYKIFHVDSFGALPDDGKDDIDAIQATVNAVEKEGRGVVKFSAGVYDFDVTTEKRFVTVSSSNIVILGAGEGPDGTTLHDHAPSWYHDETKKWLAGRYPGFFLISKLPSDSTWYPAESANAMAHITKGHKNSRSLIVNPGHNLEAGKTYLLTMKEDSANNLLKDLTFPLKRWGKARLNPDGFEKHRYRQYIKVTAINGNEIKTDIPLFRDMRPEFHPELWEADYLVGNVVVAGFHLLSDWHETFYHHKNSIHDNGWDHIKVRYAVNTCVFSIIHSNTSTAIGLSHSKNCSVYDCQIRGNPGHNGFVLGGASTANLLFNLKGGQQMHTYTITGQCTGNVFHNCWSEEPSAIDCHASVSVNNLFDNIYCATWKHGGNKKYLPPAHAQGLVLWNWKAGYSEPYKGKVKNILWNMTEVPGIIAVGVQGLYGQEIGYTDLSGTVHTSDLKTSHAHIEFFNRGVKPASLYVFQKNHKNE